MKVLSAENERFSKAKEFMRRQMYFVCLEYKTEDRFRILDKTLEKTGVFLILDECTGISSKRMPIYKSSVDVKNVGETFDALDGDDFAYLDEFDNESKEGYEYLLIIKENGIPYDRALDLTEDGLCEYKFKAISSILRGYKIYDTFFYNSEEVVVLTHKSDAREGDIKIFEDGKELRKGEIITLLGGIGDTFIMFSLIWEAYERNKKKGIDTYILMNEHNRFWQGSDYCFFRALPNLVFNNTVENNFFKSRKADNLKDMNVSFTDDNAKGHIFELTAKVLGIEADIDPYIHREVLEKIIFDSLSAEDKEYVDATIKENTVGLQYFTGQFVDGVVVANSSRNWGEESVKEFLRLCRENNIDIVVTNGKVYGEGEDVKELKRMKLPGYVYAISKMAMVVGIDSSAGHIASFFGKPTVTIWGKQSPFDAFNKKISFRALKKNYSFWSDDGCCDSIKPEMVMEKVLDIMSGAVKLEDKVITYSDTEDCFQMRIIENK